jgi:hypothetical protein
MSQIDMSMLISAQTRADALAQDHAQHLKEGCRARILAAADPQAQTNLAAAMAADKLNTDEKAAYELFLEWIHDMRAVCKTQAAHPRWPVLPAQAADLVGRF